MYDDISIRNDLLQQLDRTDQKIKREGDALQSFEEGIVTTLLDHNLSVNLLQVIHNLFTVCVQRKLVGATATKMQKMRKLENITEAHFEKR